MKTNIKNTKFIIDGYRMNDGKINIDYFAGEICVTCINTEILYNDLKTRRPGYAVAFEWICFYVNCMLDYYGYKTVCSNYQIKKLLGVQYQPIIDAVLAEIKNYKTELY